MSNSGRFKSNELIILLGAGASCDAGIPHSVEMIRQIENSINDVNNSDWSKFKRLYDYVRSSIYYSDGIRGKFDNSVSFNIERLVNTLDELSKKNEHTLYPFVGSWNPRLVEVAGDDFKLVHDFKKAILKILRRDWIILKDRTRAEYYAGLLRFQQSDYNHPLRIFSLNYDLCVEQVCDPANAGLVERGFSKDNRLWDWREFEPNESVSKSIYLCKLHGSNDWEYNGDENLTFLDDPAPIQDDKAAMIFGTSYKLQYRDPFLFLAYEFRRWSIDASLILSVGYGYGDEHINKIIHQALNDKTKKRALLSISPFNNKTMQEVKSEILEKLEHKDQAQLECFNSGAEDFIKNNLTKEFLLGYLPKSDDDLITEI